MGPGAAMGAAGEEGAGKCPLHAGALFLLSFAIKYYFGIILCICWYSCQLQTISEARLKVKTTQYKVLVNKSLRPQGIFRKASAKNVLARKMRTQ